MKKIQSFFVWKFIIFYYTIANINSSISIAIVNTSFIKDLVIVIIPSHPCAVQIAIVDDWIIIIDFNADEVEGTFGLRAVRKRGLIYFEEWNCY